MTKNPDFTPNWFLSFSMLVDDLAPGFLTETLKATPDRKHVLAAVMALKFASCGNEIDISKEFAIGLRDSKKSNLLGLLDNQVHPAFYSIVKSSRCGIHSMGFYLRLAIWLNQKWPSNSTLKALRHGRSLDETTLEILNVLDPVAHTKTVLSIVPDVNAAKELNAEIDFARLAVPNLTSVELKTALATFASDHMAYIKASLEGGDPYIPKSLSVRFHHRAAFPEPPLRKHPKLTPIQSAKELADVGRKLKNCASRLVQTIVLENYYYYFWATDRSSAPQAFIQLERMGTLWRVVEICGDQNIDLEPELKKCIERDLSASGALIMSGWPLDFLSEYPLHDSKRFARMWRESNSLETGQSTFKG